MAAIRAAEIHVLSDALINQLLVRRHDHHRDDLCQAAHHANGLEAIADRGRVRRGMEQKWTVCYSS